MISLVPDGDKTVDVEAMRERWHRSSVIVLSKGEGIVDGEHGDGSCNDDRRI